MGIVFGAIAPHPPIVVPEIGGSRIKECEQTKKALEEMSKRLKAKDVETIIVTTPHGNVGQSAVPVYTSPVFEGNFAYFGAPKLSYKFKGDPDLAQAIIKQAQEDKIPVAHITDSSLDHGVLVPLAYPYAAGIRKPILPIAIAFIPLSDLFNFGKSLRKAVDKVGRKVALIGSADLSHRLTPEAPAGYNPAGKKFDDKLVELVKNLDVQGILNFDPDMADRAGQDALWSIAILMGALDGLKFKHEILSYEGPFGVGYMVATFDIQGSGLHASLS